jgi:hypothetical protein
VAHHRSLEPLLKARPEGVFYLQYELSHFIQIDKLEKIMQRIILKINEIMKDDRRMYSPMFTFAAVNTGDKSYIRMSMHRPSKDNEPDTVVGHFDFVETYPSGQNWPLLDLAINKWILLTRKVYNDLTAHAAKNVLNGLMDYMDPIEYAMAMAPIKEMLRLPAQNRVGIHFTVEVTQKSLNIIMMRLDKILLINQVNVENKEI